MMFQAAPTNFVITYTFSTCGENHVGNEKIGEMRDGFDQTFFSKLNHSGVQIHNLAEGVQIPQNMNALLATYKNFCGNDSLKIQDEAKMLYWDEHKWDTDTKTVQAKHARSNTMLCYQQAMKNSQLQMPNFSAYEVEYKKAVEEKAEIEARHNDILAVIDSFANYADRVRFRKTLPTDQNDIYTRYENVCKKIKAIPNGIMVTKEAIAKIKEKQLEPYLLQYPDYLQGKGTVYNIDTLPYTSKLSQKVQNFCAEHGYVFDKKAFVIEGNFYHDIEKCYIGFHGDTEREVVFGVRLGNSEIPLFYGWWYKNNLVENSIKCFVPSPGDAYIMSKKAVGRDWKSSSTYTLRHAAGDILTLEKQKSLETIMKKDPFFINRLLDPSSRFITYLNEEDKKKALANLHNLYVLGIKKNNNKKSAEQTLIDKYEANKVAYDASRLAYDASRLA